MTDDDIRLYLGDNTDLSDEDIARITPQIHNKLDYSPMFEQIDTLAFLLTKNNPPPACSANP